MPNSCGLHVPTIPEGPSHDSKLAQPFRQRATQNYDSQLALREPSVQSCYRKFWSCFRRRLGSGDVFPSQPLSSPARSRRGAARGEWLVAPRPLVVAQTAVWPGPD